MTDFHSFTVNEEKLEKISEFTRFLLRSGYAISFKIWQWLKLLNSFPIINETQVNHLYISIWSFRLTFTAFQWMKTIFKIFSILKFLLTSGYMIFMKIWKWLKLHNYVRFIKKTLVNHVYIRTWSSWPTFTVLQWMKTNFKIRQFSYLFLRSGYAILVKIWQWLKLLNSFKVIKKTLVNHLYISIWSFRLHFTAWKWMKTNCKISQFEDFC